MYEEVAFRFVQHFMWIAYAMDRVGENHDEMWDEEDGFFYDLLRAPGSEPTRLKVRSLVGLLPLCASTVFAAGCDDEIPEAGRDGGALFGSAIRGWPRRSRRPTRASSASMGGVSCPS